MSITDSNVRAAVWWGPGTGRWHVDVYFAARRVRGTSVLFRVMADRDPSAVAPIERHFAERVDALNYAVDLVGAIRAAAAFVLKERSHRER